MIPREEEPDKFNALFVPNEMGMWTFRIEGWDHPFQTWRHAVEAKLDAGQSESEMANDIEVGARLCKEAGLTEIVELLHSDAPLADKIHRAMHATEEAAPLRHFLTRTSEYRIFVERRKALVSSWYEIFPRSTGGVDENGNPIHGTFATTADELPRIKEMGFDTVYLPPIHPIGKINRKGKDNTLVAEPDDVGSPWAIGSDEGGHEAVHPALGTVEDFEALVKRAEDLDMEIAIDLALQCAPDHPWAKEHPEFFTILPDNTIAFAENPPKKYQDIYPLNFDNARKTIYYKILDVVLLWIRRGVKTFRVDNPHTKPANFWHWLISEVHSKHPEVIFLAEAFTRPPRFTRSTQKSSSSPKLSRALHACTACPRSASARATTTSRGRPPRRNSRSLPRRSPRWQTSLAPTCSPTPRISCMPAFNTAVAQCLPSAQPSLPL